MGGRAPGYRLSPSSETQGQIVGARESLNGQKNMARRKVKNGERSPWGQCLTRPVPNGRRRSAFWLGRKTQKFSAPESPRMDSHRTISKRSRECWFLIGHKKCFVLLCPIGEQHLLSSFHEFVHDGYDLATVARFVHQAFLTRNEGTTDESKNVSDTISRSNLICTEKILFLIDHNVS